MDGSSCTASPEAVEYARSARYLGLSPLGEVSSSHKKRYQRKRFASMSGKKGSDTARLKQDDQGNDPTLLLDSYSPAAPFSPNGIGPFTASQSPINSYYAGSLSDSDASSNEIQQPDVSFGDENGHGSESENSAIQHKGRLHELIDETAMSLGDQGGLKSSQLREYNKMIGLKKGATFHLNPLETKVRPRVRYGVLPQSFPDPLIDFRGGTGRRLHQLYELIRQRDTSIDEQNSKALILSLDQQQMCSIILKLLLENPLSNRTHSDYLPQASVSADRRVQGNTLIVVRERENIEKWSRCFREGSSFSVLNHTALPVKERKTTSTTCKCAKYDVVITTYDAFKSPDVTLNVNEEGFVAHKKMANGDGWYLSRGGSQAIDGETKRLSVLHRIIWRRVVFIDTVGRKSFLAKPDTSRSAAARALDAKCR